MQQGEVGVLVGGSPQLVALVLALALAMHTWQLGGAEGSGEIQCVAWPKQAQPQAWCARAAVPRQLPGGDGGSSLGQIWAPAPLDLPLARTPCTPYPHLPCNPLPWPSPPCTPTPPPSLAQPPLHPYLYTFTGPAPPALLSPSLPPQPNPSTPVSSLLPPDSPTSCPSPPCTNHLPKSPPLCLYPSRPSPPCTHAP